MTLFRISTRSILARNEKLLYCISQSKFGVRKLSEKNVEVHVADKPVPALGTNLKEILANKIESEREIVKKFKKKHGTELVSQVDVNQVYGGMRGVTCMLWETSLLDPELGIRFRGLSIPELQKCLPKAEGGEEPLPEGKFS